MPKLTLTDLTSLANQTSAVNTINANSDRIETALENTLSRDGTSPNNMEADLDMDSNRIINLPEATTDTEPVRKQELDETVTTMNTAVNTAVSQVNAIANQLEADIQEVEELFDNLVPLDITTLTIDDAPVAGDYVPFFDSSELATNRTTITGLSTAIDHNTTTNYVADQHVAHTGVTLTAGVGLSGGGDISASRTFNLDLSDLTTDTPVAADTIAFYDVSGSDTNKATITSLSTVIDHNTTTNYVADQHVAHSGVTLTAGNGLSGGGTIAASRTFDLDLNNLTTDTPVAADTIAFYDVSGSDTNKATITTLSTVIDHNTTTNYVADQHVAHSGVTITAGNGLSGGGTIAASRTIDLDLNDLTTDTPVAADTIAFYDVSGSDTNKATITTLSTVIDHNTTTNYVADQHVAHSGVSISAGSGLSGGGTIAANRTISLDLTSANTWTGAQTVNARSDAQQDIRWSGDISPAQITADQNDYNPTGLSTASTLRINSDAARNITGLQGGADGRILLIHNIGSFAIVLKDESASSTAANRFALNADVSLGIDQSTMLQYDSTSSRWRVIGGTGSGGGGSVSDGDKGDITVSGSGATWTVDNDVVTYAKMQDVSATSRILGRKTAAAGDPEECTLSEILDFIGSAAQGDILYRGASAWSRLAAGTSGDFLKTNGAGADPAWAAITGASQSDQETGSSTSVFVTPGVQKHHPSAAKFWAKWAITTTIAVSHNVASVTDNGAGDWTINLTTAFSSADWAAWYSTGTTTPGSTTDRVPFIIAQTASTLRVNTWDLSASAPSDNATTVMNFAGGFGDQ